MKSYIADSKMRARIRSAAQSIDPVLSIGKNALTPEFTSSVEEYMEKHEIIKINVLKNCDEDLHELGNTIAERSNTELVQIIGRKIVLYKPAKEEKNRAFLRTGKIYVLAFSRLKAACAFPMFEGSESLAEALILFITDI